MEMVKVVNGLTYTRIRRARDGALVAVECLMMAEVSKNREAFLVKAIGHLDAVLLSAQMALDDVKAEAIRQQAEQGNA